MRRRCFSHQVVALVQRYCDLRNRAFQAAGSSKRVGLARPGPLLRGVKGGAWTYERISRTYRRYCKAVGARPFTPHALRRTYGSRLVALLGHVDAALAGGWRDPGVLLRSYARPLHDFQPQLWLDEPPDALSDAFPRPAPKPKEDAGVAALG